MLKVQWISGLAIGALVGVSGFAGPKASAADKTLSGQTFRIQKASDLIGKSVLNPQGETLGKVNDLAIDAERGRVAYVVLASGGFLALGEKWFAIPTEALTLPADAKHFVLAADKERMKAAPGFPKDKWPSMGNSAWGMGVHKYYGLKPYWASEGEGSTPAELRIQKASEIIGREVQNDRGETLGDVKNLVIDPDRYRIAYVVLSFGGFLGMGDKLFAMPNDVLQLPATGDHAVLAVSQDRLKTAKGFDKDNWPNLADPTLAASTYEFYGQRPYWQEDLRGGEYLLSAAGKACERCGQVNSERGFVRDGKVYCCAGCANKTDCTCGAALTTARP